MTIDYPVDFAVFLEHDELDSYIGANSILAEDKTFYCGVCHKSGRQRQDIERHIESVHIVTNPWPCQICGSQLKSRRGYQTHIRTQHRNM